MQCQISQVWTERNCGDFYTVYDKVLRKQNHPRISNSFYQSEFTDFQKRWVLDRELSRHIYAVTCMHIVIRSLGPSKDQILDSNYIWTTVFILNKAAFVRLSYLLSWVLHNPPLFFLDLGIIFFFTFWHFYSKSVVLIQFPCTFPLCVPVVLYNSVSIWSSRLCCFSGRHVSASVSSWIYWS